MCKFSNSFNGNSTGSVQPQNIDGQFERAVWVWPQTLLQQETFSKWAARQTVFNMLSWVMTGGNREEINQNYIWESSEKSLVTSWRLDCNKLVWRFSYNSNIFYNKTIFITVSLVHFELRLMWFVCHNMQILFFSSTTL